MEGYRVYRGRVDAPNELQLIAQFDYTGTSISDYAGQINPDPLCAPEIAITSGCAVAFGPFTPGLPRIEFVTIPLVGEIVQVKLGERAALADGTAIALVADTAMTGNGAGYPAVVGQRRTVRIRRQRRAQQFPLLLLGDGVRHQLVAVGSLQPGVGPKHQGGGAAGAGVELREHGGLVDGVIRSRCGASVRARGRDNPCADLPEPTVDPVTGTFSGPMQPADGWGIKFGDFVKSLIGRPGNFAARLDSIQQGNPVDAGIPNVYWYSGLAGSAPPVIFSLAAGQALSGTGQTFESLTFDAVSIDNGLASRYGGSSDYKLQGQVSITMPGVYQTNGTARGAAFGDTGGGMSLVGQFLRRAAVVRRRSEGRSQ